MEVTYLDAAQQLAGILFGGCFTVLVSLLLGRIVLGQSRSLRGELTESEGWLLSFALGAAILSSLVFGLCTTGLFYDASVWILGIGVALAWTRWGRWTWEPRPDKCMPQGRSWQLLLAWIPNALYRCAEIDWIRDRKASVHNRFPFHKHSYSHAIYGNVERLCTCQFF